MFVNYKIHVVINTMYCCSLGTAYTDYLNVNCFTGNAASPAFSDPCLDEVGECVVIYYKAEYTPTSTEACQ